MSLYFNTIWQLLGDWYSYARIRDTVTIDSAKYLITRENQETLKFYYTGSR